MANTYIGITIGPVGTTMSYSSKPAGLWFASYLFSTLARLLIVNLLKQGVKAEDIVAPYFELDENQCIILPDPCQEYAQKGVGMFHDRIIFKADSFSLEQTKQVREAAVSDLAGLLTEENGDNRENLTEWLTDYLRIMAVRRDVPENEAPLLWLSKYLSAAELEPHARTQETDNPLLSMMSDNGKIRDCRLTREFGSDWVLNRRKGSGIRDLEHIAAADLPLDSIVTKPYKYYAVLNSDGDSMSKLLADCKSGEEIRSYSRNCLTFCAKAAELILNYGGMPIYAGGDDLLALLPVIGKDKDSGTNISIFAFVEQLRGAFNQVFRPDGAVGKPTISMGISVQYYKSPLYEALEQAEGLLRAAKSGKKNACHLRLQKHSGHSALISDASMDIPTANLFAQLNDIYRSISSKDADKAVEFLHGAGSQIELHSQLFITALCKNPPEKWSFVLKNLFDNLYDNIGQAGFHDYLDELVTLTEYIATSAYQESKPDEVDSDHEVSDFMAATVFAEHTVSRLLSALRILHFMLERKGDE